MQCPLLEEAQLKIMESTSFTGMIKENMCFGFDGFVRIIAMCRLISSIVLQCVKQAAVS
jgi:hypothetical protein